MFFLLAFIIYTKLIFNTISLRETMLSHVFTFNLLNNDFIDITFNFFNNYLGCCNLTEFTILN